MVRPLQEYAGQAADLVRRWDEIEKQRDQAERSRRDVISSIWHA